MMRDKILLNTTFAQTVIQAVNENSETESKALDDPRIFLKIYL